MLQSLHQLIQVWFQSISLLCNFVFHSLIRSWIWLVGHRHSFLEARSLIHNDWKQIKLSGVHLNALLETIRNQIASLMRWHPNTDEEEEDCLPTTGAKSKKSGRWFMKRMPWDDPDVGEMHKTRYQTSREAIDASFRHVMHSYFGHQSWALHTLVVAMVAYQIAYILYHTNCTHTCAGMHVYAYIDTHSYQSPV